MNRKQWVYLSLALIFLVLLVFNFLEYQKSERGTGPILFILANILFIIAMGVMWYYAKRKSK